jgi:hypothetical protein
MALRDVVGLRTHLANLSSVRRAFGRLYSSSVPSPLMLTKRCTVWESRPKRPWPREPSRACGPKIIDLARQVGVSGIASLFELRRR